MPESPLLRVHKSLISERRPGYGEVKIRKRRPVLNHLGTVHAIAMCNMAELAGSTMTDVSIPLTHSWIPKGMEVEYLKKAETDLTAVATAELPLQWPKAGNFIATWTFWIPKTRQSLVWPSLCWSAKKPAGSKPLNGARHSSRPLRTTRSRALSPASVTIQCSLTLKSRLN
ncbi:DUF4442 domain-containing protein [Alcanivorax jadensis]|uniref:DUF4442 domain-containing protein n=1 Tax=Alcanivorax TaxID=59753 RepID=UPI0039C87BE2